LKKPKEANVVIQEGNFYEFAAKHWEQSFKDRHSVEAAKSGADNVDRLLGLDGSNLMRDLPGKDHCKIWERCGEPVLSRCRFIRYIWRPSLPWPNFVKSMAWSTGLKNTVGNYLG
jgi:hypothetical protein